MGLDSDLDVALETLAYRARVPKQTKVVHPLKLHENALHPRRVSDGKPLLIPTPEPFPVVHPVAGAHLRRSKTKREKLPDALFDPLFSNESIVRSNEPPRATSKMGSFIRRCSTPDGGKSAAQGHTPTAEDVAARKEAEKVKGELFSWISKTEMDEQRKENEKNMLAYLDDDNSVVLFDCTMDDKARVGSRGGLDMYWTKKMMASTSTLEWFTRYWRIKPFVHMYMRSKKNILVMGCGNSELSYEIYRDGCENVTNIDISREVVEHQESKFKGPCKNMKWVVMDARTMTFLDNSFDVVVDKGLTDTLLACNNGGVHARKMSAELYRVMIEGGTWIIVSGHADISAAKCNGQTWSERSEKIAENDHFVYVHFLTKVKKVVKEKVRKFDPARDLIFRS